MKALIYKEFKLAMHPICYIFIVLFPFMVLIPVYPLGISFIYILACYPILFLGANKGQQSNDLLYSTLLPVRKKDIVLARIMRWRNISEPTDRPSSCSKSRATVARDAPVAAAICARPNDSPRWPRMYSSARRTTGLVAAMKSVEALTVIPRGGIRIGVRGGLPPSMRRSRSSAPS